MHALDLLRRERFMSLRGVQAAKATLTDHPRGVESHERLREALGFFREFVVDYHFTHSEAVLLRWDELRGGFQGSGSHPGLAASHARVASQLADAEASLERLDARARGLPGILAALLEHLSRTLLADDDCFHEIEVEVDQARASLLAELSIAAADPIRDARHAALLDRLERSGR